MNHETPGLLYWILGTIAIICLGIIQTQHWYFHVFFYKGWRQCSRNEKIGVVVWLGFWSFAIPIWVVYALESVMVDQLRTLYFRLRS